MATAMTSLKSSPTTTVPTTKLKYQWGENVATRLNSGLKPLTPIFLVILVTWSFNQSSMGHDFLTWLNRNYTPFEINAYWSFGITSVVYWIGAWIFMALDLLKPSFVQKYKIQPAKDVTWKDYKKIMWIVLRNQVCLVDIHDIALR